MSINVGNCDLIAFYPVAILDFVETLTLLSPKGRGTLLPVLSPLSVYRFLLTAFCLLLTAYCLQLS